MQHAAAAARCMCGSLIWLKCNLDLSKVVFCGHKLRLISRRQATCHANPPSPTVSSGIQTVGADSLTDPVENLDHIRQLRLILPRRRYKACVGECDDVRFVFRDADTHIVYVSHIYIYRNAYADFGAANIFQLRARSTWPRPLFSLN